MMVALRKSLLLLFGLPVMLLLGNATTSAATDQRTNVIQSHASGDGSYMAQTGYYFGPGTDAEFGPMIFNGTLTLDPIGDPMNGLFAFENKGRGTADEILHQVIHEQDGSTISTRYQGTVQLMPEFDTSGNPTGLFTAEWTGVWRVVTGTGRFRGARGFFNVTAINRPFDPTTDPVWHFDWSWDGEIHLANPRWFKKCFALEMTTGGHGRFDPANLGLGDPTVYPFPLVIGDGSGTGIYDGTPTGHEFMLGGQLVGNGFDQHFGTAQSLSPGIPVPSGVLRYPGVSGPNPDGSGREIHIMKTWLGEIWFDNKYYFELDPAAGAAGTIRALADFRIVGGTFFFQQAEGSVFVRVFSDLANDFDPGDPAAGIPPSAGFRYDFVGRVEYCFGRR